MSQVFCVAYYSLFSGLEIKAKASLTNYLTVITVHNYQRDRESIVIFRTRIS